MHIKIVGFKCHLDASYDFDNDSMILLKGKSGAGKSTILQAIFWGLYGSMRGVYNNSGQIKKCSVTLQINHLIIYRQKRPELLKVTIINPNDKSENTYQDAVAQQIIDQAFGTKELWKSCSYVSQKERCSLLSGSASDRLSLLNQLSFDQDNPKEYIKTIDERLKEVNKEFLQWQASFTTELNLFTKQISTRPVKHFLNEEQMNQLVQDIDQLELETQRLYQEVLSHERIIGSYNMVSNQLQQAENQLKSFDNIEYNENQSNMRINQINDIIKGLREQITLIRHYNNIKTRAEKLQSDINNNNTQINTLESNISNIDNQINLSMTKLETLGYNTENPITVTDQMIWQATQQENQHRHNISECQELGCEYTSESINSFISKMQQEISMVQNMERNVQIYNQLKFLQSQFSSITVDQELLSQQHISDLEKQNNTAVLEISELKKGLELLQCPECLKSLRYVNKQLIPGERDPVNPIEIQQKETEYRARLHQITSIRNALQLQSQIQTLESQLSHINLSELEEYMKCPKNVYQHQGLISRLTRIQIIPTPQYSSSYLQAIHNHNQLILQQNHLKQQKENIIILNVQLSEQLNNIQIPNVPSIDLPTLNSEIAKNESDLRSLQEIHQKYIRQQATKKQLLSSLQNLKSQQQELCKSLNPNSKTIYETTQNILKEQQIKLSEAQYAKQITAQQEQLENKRQQVLNLNEDLVALQRLKQNAINVECKQLQDTVDTINQTLADILPLFFNEPIDMVLQLYKTLKTKKQIRPGLNISIKYKGVEYDNINQLSGGEGDRISLALVLVLNQVSSSPVIMLDECVSSLDGALKESCIKTMKNMEGKTIICVDHEGVEGYYDKTIMVTH